MVDKQEHASDICGAIGDLVELDEAVQAALDYQADNPDTLIVVTGDHAHSTQIVAGPTDGKQTATVKTADGDPMTVAYSTSDVGSDHTGTQIRVAASGPQGANVTGVIDQTDLFLTLLGREPSDVPGTEEPKPVVNLAAAQRIGAGELKRRGLVVSVAGAAASKIKVTLVAGGRTLASKTLGGRGGTPTLKVRNARPGKLTVKAVATGAGGTASDSQNVRVTR